MTLAETAVPSKIVTFEDVRVANNGAYPGFFFLRHFLATVIIFHHARILLRGVREGYADLAVGGNALSGQGLGSFLFSAEALRPFLYALVGAFFALSGFLVAGSALRTRNVKSFLMFRVLRIVPALVAEVTLAALILGSLATILSYNAYFASPDLYRYFFNIVGFIHYTLPGVFLTNPIAETVNGNLWTLTPEFYCYLILAGAMVTGLAYNRRFFLILLIAVTLIIVGVQASGIVEMVTRQDTTRFTRWLIVYMFFLGVAFYLYRDSIPRSLLLFVISGVGYVLLLWTGKSDLLACILLAYCTVYVGSLDFSWFDRTIKSDYSYGLYLYGYPITQALIYFLLPSGILKQNAISTAVLMIATFALALGFSALSWHFLESPALRLRKYFMRKEA